MPVRIRNGASPLVELGDDVELLAQSIRRQPVGDRESRRVVGQDEVLVAELLSGTGHFIDRAAAVGPIGVSVAVALQGGANLPARSCLEIREGALQPGEVRRLHPGQRLHDDLLGLVAHPWQCLQPPCDGKLQQLRLRNVLDRGGGVAEGAHAIRRLAHALEQLADAIERVDRVHRMIMTRRLSRPCRPCRPCPCEAFLRPRRHRRHRSGHRPPGPPSWAVSLWPAAPLPRPARRAPGSTDQ